MRLRFISTQTVKGLWSNRAMAVAVILVTFVSLLFIGTGALLQRQVSVVRDELASQLRVSVFMCPNNAETTKECADGEATQEQIDALEAELTGGEVSKYVESYEFESKKEALENYREEMAGTGLSTIVDESDMQVSFRVKLVDPLDYKVVSENLSGRDGVEKVEDQRDEFEPLFNILNRFMRVAVVLAVVMVITALLLIPTTIRLSAMSRRDETEIMRYVGASNFFIELPFILEGVVSALIGSLLAVGGLCVAIRYFVQDWLDSAISSWIDTIGITDVFILAPVLVLGAVVVAALASWLTLRRYATV
ncbi:MAG: permease-like cell division protein FtsX [Actinomycetaceae bacterium]|nr:permease-like cell division protein FtsX [Actinomycetaceae bacterium]